MEALEEWTRPWPVLQHFRSVLYDGALDLDDVANDFCGRPTAFARAGLPLVGGNGLGGGQESRFSASQVFGDGFERGHCLDFGSCRLLEGVRKLEDARFAKGRAKDL